MRRFAFALGLAALSAALLAPQAALAGDLSTWNNTDYIAAAKAVYGFEPYTREKHATTPYDPKKVDWSGVIGAIYSLLQYEKRYGAFLIRGAFHDCMAVNTTLCSGPGKSAEGCRGCDGSMLLDDDEMGRIENSVKKWSARLSKPLRMIAAYYGCSIADVLAVGGAAATRYLSYGRVKIIGEGLRVGRLDYTESAPQRVLPAPFITTNQFIDFWQSVGFKTWEGVALMGSHSLLDNNFCQRGLRDYDMCNPEIECCEDIKGMRWENHYYQDMCSGGLTITKVDKPEFAHPVVTPISAMNEEEYRTFVKEEMCGFTSYDSKATVRGYAQLIKEGKRPLEEFPSNQRITWSQEGCPQTMRYGVRPEECPHVTFWPYTLNDAFNGQVCVNDDYKIAPAVRNLRNALRAYTNQRLWDKDYTQAYIHMTEAWMDMPGYGYVLPDLDAGYVPDELLYKLQSVEKGPMEEAVLVTIVP